MLSGFAPDDEHTREHQELAAYVEQVFYRKEMGLSFAQYCAEPIGLRSINMMILLIQKQIEHKVTHSTHG